MTTDETGAAQPAVMCKAHTRAGKPCRHEALPFTINGTCRRHHNAVRRWAQRHGYYQMTPWGIVDTWGSPLGPS